MTLPQSGLLLSRGFPFDGEVFAAQGDNLGIAALGIAAGDANFFFKD